MRRASRRGFAEHRDGELADEPVAIAVVRDPHVAREGLQALLQPRERDVDRLR